MARAVILGRVLSVLIWAGLAGMAAAQAPADPPAVRQGGPIMAQVRDTPATETGGGTDQAAPPTPSVTIEAGEELPSAVLVLDVDQAYDSSAWGRRAQDDLQQAAREIEAENKRLEAQLTAEEQALTAARATLAPDVFRKKAEEFDARAQQVRRDRAETARDLGVRAEADRNAFLDASLPVVTALMQEHRAAVVLDRRQTLLAITTVDITAELVRRMDAEIGVGGPLPDAASRPGPTPEDAAAAAQNPVGTAPAEASPPAPAPEAAAP